MSLFSHHKGGRGAGGYPDRKRGAGNGGRHVKIFFLQTQKQVNPNINDADVTKEDANGIKCV